MTKSRAIQSAATSEAKTLTHQASTTSKLASETPSTSQSSRNQMTGATTPGSTANGCSNFWNRKRDLSGGRGAAASVLGWSFSGKGDVCTRGPVWDRSTYYYTPRAAIRTDLRQAVSASGHSKTPRCSQASMRAVAASRVLASKRLSWVKSQVSLARRERAEGSLSNSAGNRPRASTNSRNAAVEGAFGAGVRSNFSQVTQRFARPARVRPRPVRRLDSPSARESARLR